MELWKPVVDFEGIYSISSLGKVRRDKSGPHTFKGRILKPGWQNDYKFVLLVKDKKVFSRRIHRLVIEAFLGKRPKNMVIDHINRDKQDNSLENLRYVSQKINVTNSNRGDRGLENLEQLKIKQNQKKHRYQMIKNELEEGILSSLQLARKYGVSYITVYSWRKGLRMQHFFK